MSRRLRWTAGIFVTTLVVAVLMLTDSRDWTAAATVLALVLLAAVSMGCGVIAVVLRMNTTPGEPPTHGTRWGLALGFVLGTMAVSQTAGKRLTYSTRATHRCAGSRSARSRSGPRRGRH